MLSIEEAAAIERFALSVTIPILYDVDHTKPPVLYGTGCLFKLTGRRFVITAAHLFDGLADPQNLAYPETLIRSAIHTFGTIEVARPKSPSVDVAVVEVRDPQTIGRLEAGWNFLTLENVSAVPPNGTFFLSGYPTSLTEKVGGWLHGRFATIYSERIADVPPEAPDVQPDVDLFFVYGHEAYTLDGKPVPTPELPGTSGASIWQYHGSDRLFWLPQDAVKVVGVQSAYIHDKYFRGQSWLAVAELLRQFDEDLARTLEGSIKR